MAKIFQEQRFIIDPETKARIPVVDATGKPVYNAHWHSRITDHNGRRLYLTLSTNKAQAQREADMIENREREIRLGLRPPASKSEKAMKRAITDVLGEYFAWGNAQGGRKGNPWAPSHFRNKQTILTWWFSELQGELLFDVHDCMSEVERLLREVSQSGRPDPRPGRNKKPLSGKTLQSMAGELKSFFSWCVTRKYLTTNPLSDLGKFNTTPGIRRRALTVEEIQRLLDAAPLYLRILLEIAICSGLRLKELRSLTEDHFDPHAMTLRIDASVDKGRTLRYQKLPKRLVGPLAAFISSGMAKALYQRYYSRRDCTSPVPDSPLLFVPNHAARSLARIAKDARVEWHSAQGKIDFHALRVAYINLVIRSGADIKTAQELARHETPGMTMNVYGRADDERMTKIVDAVGEMVIWRDESGVDANANPVQRVGLGKDTEGTMGYALLTAN